VGLAVIENQNDSLITSSKFYFQALLSAIALTPTHKPVAVANRPPDVGFCPDPSGH
jgi:hypothetical protein